MRILLLATAASIVTGCGGEPSRDQLAGAVGPDGRTYCSDLPERLRIDNRSFEGLSLVPLDGAMVATVARIQRCFAERPSGGDGALRFVEARRWPSREVVLIFDRHRRTGVRLHFWVHRTHAIKAASMSQRF